VFGLIKKNSSPPQDSYVVGLLWAENYMLRIVLIAVAAAPENKVSTTASAVVAVIKPVAALVKLQCRIYSPYSNFIYIKQLAFCFVYYW